MATQVKQKEITFFHLKELIDICNMYIRFLNGKKNPISVKFERISASLKSAMNDYNSLIEDIRTDHCSLDADGNMIIKEGAKGEDRFTFKPAKLKEMRAKIKELDTQKTFVDVNIVGSVPKDVTYLMVKYLRGIIIPEDYKYIETDIEAVVESVNETAPTAE